MRLIGRCPFAPTTNNRYENLLGFPSILLQVRISGAAQKTGISHCLLKPFWGLRPNLTPGFRSELSRN